MASKDENKKNASKGASAKVNRVTEDDKALELQGKKFRANIVKPTAKKEDDVSQAIPVKSKLDPKLRHLHCVDEKELRAAIAADLLSLGLYPNAKSGYEKVINAQTQYLANAVLTRGTVY